MMDLSDFTAQVQAAHWGWTIALFLWLVGLSGMGMFLNNWVQRRRSSTSARSRASWARFSSSAI